MNIIFENNTDVSNELIKSVFDKSYMRLNSFFDIDKKWKYEEFIVRIENNTSMDCSYSEESSIFINLGFVQNMDIAEHLEMLITHEMAHSFVGNHWGSAVVLFHEGLPVYIADNYTRNESYSKIANYFLDKGFLIPLRDLLISHNYTMNRPDMRYDIFASSFIDFIISRFGKEYLRKIFSKREVPSEINRVVNIQKLFYEVFELTTRELEEEWIIFLKTNTYDSSYSFTHNENYEARFPCKLCYYPSKIEFKTCPYCKSKNVDIEYIF